MVIEWDLLTCKPKAKYQAHGAIYDSKVLGKFVYLACEDGSIRVVKVKKKKIELIKMLVKSEAACLSIEVVKARKSPIQRHSKKTDGSDESDIDSEVEDLGGASHAYAGYADGTIKKWDLSSGNCILHVEKQSKKESQGCLIWRLLLFKGYLISGDSKGEVCVWDQAFGTLFKKFT